MGIDFFTQDMYIIKEFPFKHFSQLKIRVRK